MGLSGCTSAFSDVTRFILPKPQRHGMFFRASMVWDSR